MKIKPLFFSLAVFCIAACSDDDNTSGDYYGTWEATQIDTHNCDNSTLDNIQSVQCNDNTCYRIVFNTDFTYSFQRGLEIETGNWEASGVILTLCRDEDGERLCDEPVGALAGSSMRLSYTDADSGCITAYIMQRAATQDDGSDDGN